MNEVKNMFNRCNDTKGSATNLNLVHLMSESGLNLSESLNLLQLKLHFTPDIYHVIKHYSGNYKSRAHKF